MPHRQCMLIHIHEIIPVEIILPQRLLYVENLKTGSNPYSTLIDPRGGVLTLTDTGGRGFFKLVLTHTSDYISFWHNLWGISSGELFPHTANFHVYSRDGATHLY